MSYATQADMVSRFGEEELIELTDRADPPLGVIDAAVLADAIADADAMIDSYIGRRYALPLATVPAVLVQVACALTRKALFKDLPPDEVVANHKDAMRYLENVSRGVAELGVAGVEVAADTTGAPQLQSGPQIFTTDTMKGF